MARLPGVPEWADRVDTRGDRGYSGCRARAGFAAGQAALRAVAGCLAPRTGTRWRAEARGHWTAL